jgi:hypothetical protein
MTATPAHTKAQTSLYPLLDNSETQIDHSHPGGDPGSSIYVRSTIRAGIDLFAQPVGGCRLSKTKYFKRGSVPPRCTLGSAVSPEFFL